MGANAPLATISECVGLVGAIGLIGLIRQIGQIGRRTPPAIVFAR